MVLGKKPRKKLLTLQDLSIEWKKHLSIHCIDVPSHISECLFMSLNLPNFLETEIGLKEQKWNYLHYLVVFIFHILLNPYFYFLFKSIHYNLYISFSLTSIHNNILQNNINQSNNQSIARSIDQSFIILLILFHII